MPSLKRIPRNNTLSEQVAAQIMGMISSGTFKCAQKLPSESELCQSLGVGRSTLREGLKALSFLGLVRVRAGEGYFVAEGHSDFLHRAFGHGLLRGAKDLNDLFETRMLLENKLAALCARQATDEDLQRLADVVHEMRQVVRVDPERFAQLDLEFHLAVAAGSKNRVLARLFQAMRDLLNEWIRKSGYVPADRDEVLAQHQNILEALEQRNSRKATSAMRRHLRGVPRPYGVLLAASEAESASRESAEVSDQRSQRPLASRKNAVSSLRGRL